MQREWHQNGAQTRVTLACLCASYLLALLPLYGELNLLVYLVSLLAIGWRSGNLLRRWPLPSRRLLNSLALLCGIGILLISRHAGLLNAMLNLLVVASALKFVECRHRRDIGGHILALFFLGALTFVYHQHWLMLFYLLAMVTLNLAALLSLYYPAPARPQLRQAGVLLLQSLPLMLLFFVIMPRLDPLWKMPDARQAKTGLSEQINPEQISQLTQSSELVFRARFDAPPPQARYWRTLVYEQFDGHAWQQSYLQTLWQQQALAGELPMPAPGGAGQGYQLLTEPSNQSWLYTLEGSVSQEPNLVRTPTGVLLSRIPLLQKARFTLQWHADQPLEPRLSARRRADTLQLPAHGNPLTRALAQRWRQRYPDDKQLLQQAMAYLRDGGFRYTLNPVAMGTQDGIDQLLFRNKEGFCAHYASALAFLLRAAGIPARLVGGYLGGEYQPQEKLVSVHQFDAHAWVEVWLAGGWQRVDPTMMVAPDRLTQGLDTLLGEGDFIAQDPFSLSRYRHVMLLNTLRLMLANIDYHWSLWVLNYDHTRQEAFLKQLFGDSLWRRALGLLAGAGLCAALIWGGYWLRQRRTPQDPWLRHYQRACQLLARAGYPRHEGETPLHYLQRLQQQGCRAAPALAELTATFVQRRYMPAGGRDDAGQRQLRRQQWRALRRQLG